MNNASNGPMLKAAGLWQKTSVKGGQYLTGRLGAMKVLVMENRERKSDNDPSHILYFVEAQERSQERGDGARAPQAPWTPQTPPEAQRRSFQAQAPLDHHELPPEWAR
jgi:hypothetical protein